MEQLKLFDMESCPEHTYSGISCPKCVRPTQEIWSLTLPSRWLRSFCAFCGWEAKSAR